MTDSLSPQRRSANMRSILSKDTRPELVVRRIIHRMGYRYRLHDLSLPGKPDIVLTRHRKIVEVHGCFWHQHGKCADSHIPKSRIAYWLPKLQRNQARDAEKLRKLRALGFRVLVVWECELKKPTRLTNRLRRFLESSRPSTAHNPNPRASSRPS